MLASESLAMLKVSNWETVLLRSHLPLVASGRAHSTAPWPLTRRDFFGVISFTFGHMGNRVISYNIYIYIHTPKLLCIRASILEWTLPPFDMWYMIHFSPLSADSRVFDCLRTVTCPECLRTFILDCLRTVTSPVSADTCPLSVV